MFKIVLLAAGCSRNAFSDLSLIDRLGFEFLECYPVCLPYLHFLTNNVTTARIYWEGLFYSLKHVILAMNGGRSLSSDCTWRTVSMANLGRLMTCPICITRLYTPMDRFLLPLALVRRCRKRRTIKPTEKGERQKRVNETGYRSYSMQNGLYSIVVIEVGGRN